MRITDVNKLRRISRALFAACAAALLGATPLAASAEEPAPTGGTQPTASDRWTDYSVEVYGTLVARTGKMATLLPLVATTATPVAAGTKAVLFRRIDDPESPNPVTYVEIARVTMKKIESTGNMQLVIDSEAQPPAAQKGKRFSYFARGARLKLAIE